MSRPVEEGAAASAAGGGQRGGGGIPLRELARVLEAGAPPDDGEARISGIAFDSGEVRGGELFFAVPGTSVDGHDFLEEASRRGAAAAVVQREVPGATLPLLQVRDVRRALARAAATWFGEPARALTLVGITGTLGKTSVLSLLEACLGAAGESFGTIGSLGVHLRGRERSTGHTAPDPLTLHAALAAIAHAGSRIAAMEVTSHALDQERVHGLHFALGIFTNLVPLEHSDYHGSFHAYTQVKRRFLDYMERGAPLIYNADDRAVAGLVGDHEGTRGVGVGLSDSAAVRIEPQRISAAGSRLCLRLCERLPLLSGGALEPQALDLSLSLLGRSNVGNAALAATAALMLGAPPAAVREALEDFPAPPRRMQIFEVEGVQILDDTVGHPDSVSAVFEVAEALAPPRMHAAFAIRGSRGPRINRRTAEALAIWAARLPPATLIVTPSAGAVEDRDAVTPQEREAFTGALRRAGVGFAEEERLEDAVGRVLEAARPGDLVMLLGAQGMDHGGEIARGGAAE
jgi:UDP-N-acetylmuramoyl-L-alanyl-D-glutamate--2,6-diaminopimelate ligase